MTIFVVYAMRMILFVFVMFSFLFIDIEFRRNSPKISILKYATQPKFIIIISYPR